MIEPQTERRAAPRASFSGITLVHTPGREIRCIAGNLSSSGILLYPQPRRTAETPRQMRVTFALPTSPRWIELKGTVVREATDTHRPAWGVRFDKVPDDTGRLLTHYVTTVARHRRPRVVTPAPLPQPPAPAPDQALAPLLSPDEDASTEPGSPFEETTSRLPAEEAALLTATLTPGEEPPTRRTDEDEVLPLRDRCRNAR